MRKYLLLIFISIICFPSALLASDNWNNVVNSENYQERLTVLAYLNPCLHGNYGNQDVSESGGGGGDPCGCSGTYTSCYTGDYSGDTDKICINSGASSKDGTNNNLDHIGTDYIEYNAQDENLTFASVLDDVMSADVGTLYFTLYVVGDGDIGNNLLVESVEDANNRIVIYIDGTNDRIYAWWKGQGTADTIVSANNSVTADGWLRVGWAFDQINNPNPDHSVSCVAEGNAPNWVDENDDLVAWATGADDLTFGEKDSALAVQDTIRIKDAIFLPTYKAADPL